MTSYDVAEFSANSAHLVTGRLSSSRNRSSMRPVMVRAGAGRVEVAVPLSKRASKPRNPARWLSKERGTAASRGVVIMQHAKSTILLKDFWRISRGVGAGGVALVQQFQLLCQVRPAAAKLKGRSH